MQVELRKGENIIKASSDGWHVIVYGEKFGAREMFKAAYRKSLFRTPLLTNQRLLFLRDEEIDQEIPLNTIVEVTPHRQLMIGTPYLRIRSSKGSVVSIVFECITERALFGAGVESEIAWRTTKEWVSEIDRQFKETRSAGSLSSQAAGCEYCTNCGAKLSLDSNYCPHCGTDVEN